MRLLFHNKQIVIFLITLLFFYFFSTYLSHNSFFVGDDFTMLFFKDVSYLKSFLLADNWWRPFKNIFYNYFNLNYYFRLICDYQSKIFLHVLITIIIYFYFFKFSKNLNLS